MFLSIGMLKLNYFLADIFILSAEKQPIKLSWRKIECLRAGKTQVLATRAVNAQIRTGGNILILTYNKTLSNYLRYRINDVRADFYWNKLHISHYHHFFKEQAQTIGKHVYFNSFDNTTFFDNKENDIEHFDAIFIDEVQSYKSEWLQILYNKFLKENGEFVVFGDPKQNIYKEILIQMEIFV